MNKLQMELEAVYRLLNAIPVKGDEVDIMAGARNSLRKAFRLAAEMPEITEEVPEDGGQ